MGGVRADRYRGLYLSAIDTSFPRIDSLHIVLRFEDGNEHHCKTNGDVSDLRRDFVGKDFAFELYETHWRSCSTVSKLVSIELEV